MKKKGNFKVTSRECRGNVERMIRKFIKKTKKERIIEEIREKRYYKKPSVAKKEKVRRLVACVHVKNKNVSKQKERRNRNRK